MKDTVKLINSKQSFTTLYHPQGNGGVERFNKTIKQMLQKCASEENWDEILPLLTYKYNSNIHNSTNFSPFQIIFGKKPREFLTVIDNDCAKAPSTHSFLQKLKNNLTKITKLTKLKQKKSISHLNNYKKKLESLKPGEIVLHKYPNQKNWKGPYKVISRKGPVNYVISNNNEEFTAHINNIKKYFILKRGKKCEAV